MEDLVYPTITVAENGFPLAKKVALLMQDRGYKLQGKKNAEDIFGKSFVDIVPGRMIRSQKLATCLKVIAAEGPKPFYCGKIAENMIQCVNKTGGVLTLDDMKHYYENSQKIDNREIAIYKDFRGFRIWEPPPNTIGIIVLHALGLLEEIDLKSLGHNSAEYIHVVSNALREAIFYCSEYACDPKFLPNDFYNTILNNSEYKGINQITKPLTNTANDVPSEKVTRVSSGDTSYMTVVDEDGNACSLISSVCSGLGNIPDDCGFLLHDRGKFFSLDESSRNAFGPGKRPLHTLLGSIVTDPSSGELLASFGLTGSWMQPQGHVQLLLNMIIFGMDPQMALDQPRFFVGHKIPQAFIREFLHVINVECGIHDSTIYKLKNMGHKVIQLSTSDSYYFGHGHIIAKPKLWSNEVEGKDSHCLWSGTEPRLDGIAIGY